MQVELVGHAHHCYFYLTIIPVLGQPCSHCVSRMEDVRRAAEFFNHISIWPQVYLHLAVVFD